MASAVCSFTPAQNLPSLSTQQIDKPSFLEFFAGSGLVSQALAPYFSVAWANDVCPKKAAVFQANHDATLFHLGSIAEVKGWDLPDAALSWASFPCQDLSLAGKAQGIHASRSGLVWEWLRVMDEMRHRPSVIAAENVVGLVSTKNGEHYRKLHVELVGRGYVVGAMVLDAVRWLPQSRPRVFVVGVNADLRSRIPLKLMSDRPTWLHSAAMINAAAGLEQWIWWSMPEPAPRSRNLSDVVDRGAPCADPKKVRHTLALIPETHMKRLNDSGLDVAPGYKRIRNGKQVLELRFDDVAGCLRTPCGGSSRQYLVLRRNGQWTTRLLTVGETAILMGAPRNYKIPGSYNDGYRAMGDAVAVPAARHLAKHLLAPLAALHA